ncbi:MAG: hypothetical protein ACSHXZ_15105 [Gammaproteobacteria bacterium]
MSVDNEKTPSDVHEHLISEVPEGVAVYVSEPFTMVDFFRPGNSGCPATALRTSVEFNLKVISETQGNIRARFRTYDFFGGIPGSVVSEMESDVLFNPTSPIRISSQTGPDYLDFHRAQIFGAAGRLEVLCADRTRVIRDGNVCRTIWITSKASLSLTQISGVSRNDDYATIQLQD